ncbi:MAG TPA: methyltransferase domain-containing protein [Xanthobacteraceae bacterium]|jgi:SAM-dependent methyltransferase
MAPASPTLIFDQSQLAVHRQRAAKLGPSTFLLERAAQELSERLATLLRRFDRALDLGTPGDAVRRELVRSGKVDTVFSAGPCEVHPDGTLEDSNGIIANQEMLPFREGSLDLVVSVLSLQFVDDLPGALVQIRRALKPDGLLLAALAGGDTLTELRQCFAAAEIETRGGASPRVIPFLGVREAGALLQRAGFALPVADVDRVTVRYASAIALMHDLRAMGATNPLVERSRRFLKRTTLERLVQTYADRFCDPDKRIRATFETIWLCGWAPHAGQQKPLTPGSAGQRLADALGVKEVSAGERAQR